VSWLQSRLLLRKAQNLISIELMEGIPSRPFAGKLDVFTPGITTAIIEPLLDFLCYRIRPQVFWKMVDEYYTCLASFLSKGELTGRRRYSSPIILSMS
jgi:hypothetical protein